MGQVCVSSKHFIVVRKERGSQFLDGLIKYFESLKVGDPSDSSTTLGPLSAEQGLNDLIKQIEIAESHRAHIVMGGKRIDRPGFYMEPTIITDITKDNPIFHEEAFGPVASPYIVDNDEEAIQLANATKYGLGACTFGRDTAHAQAIAARIDSGMVWINSSPYFATELPFGGVKNSGFGRELGDLGIGEFVNRKLVRAT
jgi:succinate-semialdehyde dehydrogenase/glutarate-semialdehyde dehydrogenase